MTPLSTRNYRLALLYSVAVSTPLYWPYMFHYTTETLGLSPTQFGTLKALYYFTVVICEIPFGVVADRLSRKWVLLVGAVCQVLGCLVYWLADSFAALACAEVCFGFGTALASGAGSALVYDSFCVDERASEYPRFEGRIRSAALLAMTLGLPASDLWLVHGEDPTLTYLASLALCALGTLAATGMVEPPRESRVTAREIGLASIREARNDPGIRHLILYSAGVFVMMRGANALLFNPLMSSAGVPLNSWGTTLAAVGLVGAACAWQTHAALDRWGERTVRFAVPASCVAMYGLLATVDSFAMAWVFCLNGIAIGALPVVVVTGLNRRVSSSDKRATILSIESMISRACYGLAGIGIGMLLDYTTLTIALLATVAAGLAPLAIARLIDAAHWRPDSPQ
jgi:predicted MFS family arabinose efflux permease